MQKLSISMTVNGEKTIVNCTANQTLLDVFT